MTPREWNLHTNLAGTFLHGKTESVTKNSKYSNRRMEIVERNSEKMKVPSSTFERAVVNTFNKLNKITDYGSGVSIGPNSTITECDLLDASNVPTIIENTTCDGNSNIENKNDDNHESDTTNSAFYAGIALVELENLRRIDLVDTINQRIQKMVNVETELKSRSNETLKLMKEEMHINKKIRRKIIESNINDDDLIITRKFSELLKNRLELKSKNENEGNNEKNLKLENNEEIKLKIERLNTIRKIHSDYSNVYGKISENIEKCKNRNKLSIIAASDLKKITDFNTELNNISVKIKTRNIEKSDVEACEMILQGITLLAEKLNNNISQINDEEIKNEAAERRAKAKQEEIIVEKPEAMPVETIQADDQEENVSDRYACQESLEEYTKFEENLSKISKQVEAVANNPKLKDLMRKLKIAINTPINCLSSINPVHIQDKFYKITELLRGNFSFPTENIPRVTKEQYFPFLVDFMSKKFINQGENLVSTKSEDAFLLASLIVAIWIEFPDFGPVLLAHIMKKCPYTIPAYWPQLEGQSEKDFFISRGYQYNTNGTIEDQSTFLRRSTGIFMLYVAIMVCVPRKNQPHPYGLQNAWKWFAAILNLEPRPDISAAVIHTFLELAGHKLSQYYGIQFWKLMHLLYTEYLLKIEKVTSAEFRGPVSRLKEYLQNVLRDGRISQPRGILPANYW